MSERTGTGIHTATITGHAHEGDRKDNQQPIDDKKKQGQVNESQGAIHSGVWARARDSTERKAKGNSKLMGEGGRGGEVDPTSKGEEECLFFFFFFFHKLHTSWRC